MFVLALQLVLKLHIHASSGQVGLGQGFVPTQQSWRWQQVSCLCTSWTWLTQALFGVGQRQGAGGWWSGVEGRRPCGQRGGVRIWLVTEILTLVPLWVALTYTCHLANLAAWGLPLFVIRWQIFPYPHGELQLPLLWVGCSAGHAGCLLLPNPIHALLCMSTRK